MNQVYRAISLITATLLAVPAASISSPAAAAPSGDTAAADARDLYDQGRVAFDAGKFDKAAELFDAAYDQAKNPNLLYNAAVAYEEAGDLNTARERLQQYRAEAPSSEHESIDSELSRIENLIAIAEESTQDSPPVTPEPDASDTDSSSTDGAASLGDDEPNRRSGRAGLIATGTLAGVAGAVALGFGLAALQRKNAVEDECSALEGGGKPLCTNKARDLNDDRRTFALVTDIGIGVAAASAVAFTVLLIRSRRNKNQTARTAVAPMLGRHEAGAAFTARF